MPIPLKAKKRDFELSARERVNRVTNSVSGRRTLSFRERLKRAAAARARRVAQRLRGGRN